jgi:hypothetical protein
MPLWGKTDSAGDKPAWATTLENMDTTGRQLIFIDNTEAELEVNRARGFNSPGWWAYYTVEQSDGTLRYRGQECLVAISQTAVAAGDQADDAVAADAAPAAISIDAQPADVAGAADPFTGTFVVAASGGAGTLGFQWQVQTASQSARWANLEDAGVYSGTGTSTLTITAAAKADLDGFKFRCRVSDDGGALTVNSNKATLTFA